MMLRITFVLCALFCPLLLAATVTIPVGSDAQSIVNANPAGTTYSIASGVHQYFSVSPKSNDKYPSSSSFQLLFCFVLLCFALLCFALLCFALLCFALLCFALFCFVLFCFVMLCYVMLCYVCFIFFDGHHVHWTTRGYCEWRPHAHQLAIQW